MLKFYLPFAVVLFLIVSFGFLGGWPFRSAPEEAPLERTTDVPGAGEAPPEMPKADADAGDLPQDEDEQPAAASAPDGDVEAAWAKRLSEARKAGDEAFRRALSDAILNPELPKELRLSWLPELRDLNRRVVFGTNLRIPCEDVRIRPGDNLTRIALRARKAHGNNVTPRLIMRVNQMAGDVIRAGAVLAVPTETMSVRVHKRDFRLYVILGETVILDYPVGLGREDSTPEGDFIVRGKTKNPTWTMPDGRVVRYGDPEHIIGSRWMGFATTRGRTSYGIHGTVDESSIGRSESEGCIRLKKHDVEELFRLVPEGCAVTVVR